MDYGKCSPWSQDNPESARLVSRLFAILLLAFCLFACAGRDVEFRAAGEMRTAISVGQGPVK